MKRRSGHKALLFFGCIGLTAAVLKAMTHSHILLCISVPVLMAILACVIDEG